MALRRFFFFSCLSLSMFLAACGEEKPVTPAGDRKPVTQPGPTLTPVVNNEDDEDFQALSEEIEGMSVESARAELVAVLEDIGSQLEERFEGLAVKDKVWPAVKAKLQASIEELMTVPAKKSTDLLPVMKNQLSELLTSTEDAVRKAESELIRYQIQPQADDESDEGDDSEE
jgi:hypothetical protein